MQHVVGIVGSTVVGIFALAIVVLIFEMVTPIAAKADFNRTCATYIDTAEEDGGLSLAQASALVAEIEKNQNIRVDKTTISRSGTVAYLGDVQFKIEATYTSGFMTSLLTRGHLSRPFVYDKKFKNRVLVN